MNHISILGLIAGLALAALPSPVTAGTTEIYYAPVSNLEKIDVDLIRSAKSVIDLAAYSLTDWRVIEALNEAQRHGVAIRIVLDPSQRHAYEKFDGLVDIVRVKRPGPIMHLKAYAVDGTILRTGSANLSPSGLKQQDNDLVLIRDPQAAATFELRFEQVWDAARPLYEHAPAIAALEPGKANGSSIDTGPNGCAIKGNINRHGERIYHIPGGRDYARVTMADGHGKQWFCTTNDAEAAGWRKAGG